MTMADLTSLKEAACQSIDQSRDRLIEISADIHAHPELSFEEYRTADLLMAELTNAGPFRIDRGVGGLPTAFQAVLPGTVPARTVGILAELDALPQIGHACGHNLIATAALGAAMALARLREVWPGRVVLFGTPAEENGGGKIRMLDEGVFAGVDACLYVHPFSRNQAGQRSLANIPINICFYGKSSHAASAPHLGINALDALIQTFNAINALRQHVTPDVRIHGVITSGGSRPNIIPDYSEAHFLVRAADGKTAERVLEQVQSCARAGALATGARVEFPEPNKPRYQPLLYNPALVKAVRANMEWLGMVPVYDGPPPSGGMGSIDVGNVSQVIPCVEALVSVGEDLSLHTPEFASAVVSKTGEQALLLATKVLAFTALDLLVNDTLFEEVRHSFENPLTQADI